jgi:kanamycin kinase
MPDCEHIAGPPPTDVVVPEVVLTIAAGRPVRAVWENELGGLTFEVGAGDGRVFVKWSPGGDAPDLTVEAERLDWAARHTAVPRVLDVGREHGGSWMVTSALSGASAVAPEWIARPEIAVTGLGRGLRALHDALPVDDCPFSWSVDERIVRAAAVVERDAPPDDRLVVCHGDACAPNTVLDAAGPTSRWRRGAPSGTTDRDGKASSSTRTGSNPIRNVRTSIGGCGTSRADAARVGCNPPLSVQEERAVANDWNEKIIEEFRANRGQVESFGNAPLLILHTTGAKTGQERESPVLYRSQGDDLIVFASFAGAPVNPAWYHNLVAHPDATVELGTETRRVRARVADPEERDRLWEWNKQDYPGFGDYEEKTDRTIPVVILEPAG